MLFRSDHPRGEDGKFISASGGSSVPALGKSQAAMFAPAPAGAMQKPKAPQAKPKQEPVATHQKHLEGKVSEADVNRLPKDKQEQFKSMYENAARNKDHFDKINKEIAESVGGKSAVVPLKGSARAVEKIMADYEGDPSKIKDLLRTTIEIKSPADVTKAIEQLKAKYGEPVKFRNSLAHDAPSVGGSGYRDVNMVVEINGSYAEVQINFPRSEEHTSELQSH